MLKDVSQLRGRILAATLYPARPRPKKNVASTDKIAGRAARIDAAPLEAHKEPNTPRGKSCPICGRHGKNFPRLKCTRNSSILVQPEASSLDRFRQMGANLPPAVLASQHSLSLAGEDKAFRKLQLL